MLNGKRVALGVTGGIAAYKSCEIVSRLKKAGADVRVVMSENARKFIAPLTLETLSGNRAYIDQFEREFEIEHVALAKWADVFVIAPATANLIGKLANGIADDLITTCLMAATCPIMIAPAMNSAMWKSAACAENVRALTARGVISIGPESGRLACGDDDIGRMSEPEKIVAAIEDLLCRKRDCEGARVLVTAGPTIEMIDPVRYITNRSSGKMGYALAEAARDRGAIVTLISGAVNIPAPRGVDIVNITSSKQLCEAVLARGGDNDIILQAAAPADFTPAVVSDKKIKKDGGALLLELAPTTDIARELGVRKRAGQVLVAFAAETDNLIENAQSKLERKRADLIVANDVSRADAGFGVDTNAVTLITRDDMTELPLMSKRAAADAILDKALEIFRCVTRM